MNEKLGKRLELLIYAKGFSSPGKFAAYLNKNYPGNSLSEDTIRGLIRGKGFQNNTLKNVAVGLDIPMECLMTPVLPLVDAYLFGEVAEEKQNCIDLAGKGECQVKELTWIKRLYDTDCRMYPSNESDMANKYGFKISTLAELSIYFPLCNLHIISDVMNRICGQVEGYETYILEKYAWMYDEIPDIPAKRYADYAATMLRVSAKQNLCDKEKMQLQEMKEYAASGSLEDDYEQYRDLTRRVYELFNNPIMNDIFKARLPEIYRY